MPIPRNPHLRQHKIDFPKELLELLQAKALQEDENVSSLIRTVMANYVGWTGPVRAIKDYTPSNT